MTFQEEEDALIARFGNQYAPVFDELPERLRTQRVIDAWFRYTTNYDFVNASGHWSMIPPALVTDDLRQAAIAIDARIIEHIDPSHTEKYLDLFISAYQTTFRVVRLLHPDFKTGKTIDAMMASPREFERSYFVNPWIAEVMTPDQLEAASRLSDRIMAELPEEKISDVALSIHLLDGFSTYDLLFLKGKLRLAADFLKLGHWPPQITSETASPLPKPSNVAEAFELMEHAVYDGRRAVYMACLLNYPIEDIVAHMASREQAKCVLELYSKEDLRPHMRSNRHLKAVLLEESLGL